MCRSQPFALRGVGLKSGLPRRVLFAQLEATYKEGEGGARRTILLLTYKEFEPAEPQRRSCQSKISLELDKSPSLILL